jgi:hypothetical protein
MKQAGLVSVLLVLFAFGASADGIAWDLTPELGAGMTFAHQSQVGIAMGLKLGTFPATAGPVAGREFGVDLAQVGGLTGGGAWIGLTQVAGVKVRVGVLCWKDERFEGDCYIRIAKPFAITF